MSDTPPPEHGQTGPRRPDPPPPSAPSSGPRPRPVNVLAVCGLATGGVGLLLAFVPVVGIVAWPLVVVGVVLSIVALVRTPVLGGRGLAIGGLAVSVVGLAACTVVAVLLSSLVLAPWSRTSGSDPRPLGQGNPTPASAPFGQTVSYASGLEVTVSAPRPYTPSRPALIRPGSTMFAVDVAVRNGSDRTLAPGGIRAVASVEGREARRVSDAQGGVGSPPNTALLSGRTATFTMAFSSEVPAGEAQVDVRPESRVQPAVFVGPR